MLCEQLRHAVNRLRGADRLPAGFAVEHGDRQTPVTLARNTPVGALPHHLDHALLAPRGQPAHVVARRDRLVLEGVHRAEPLWRRAENDGAFAAPAVRVLVRHVLGGKQRPGLLHILQNDRIGVGIEQPGVLSGILGLSAAVIHRHDDIHAVALTGLEVIGTEAGRGMHAAGTGIHGHIVRQHDHAVAIQERVRGLYELQLASLPACQRLADLHAARLHGLFAQSLGNDIVTTVRRPDQHVLLVRVERNGKVAGQRPGCGRPDDEVGVGKRCILRNTPVDVVADAELDVNGGTGVGLVLDLRLRQRRLALGAPVHRLHALVDGSLAVHFPEHSDLPRLKGGVHGQVGMLPVGADTQPDELPLLHIHVLLRELVAGRAELRDGHFTAIQLVLLDDRRLDGHTVVVPAGDIGDAVALHGLGFVDEILENLVERRSHMDIAVGEGGAVMQLKGRLSGGVLQHEPVQSDLLPVGKCLRLARRQVCPHGKFCCG